MKMHPTSVFFKLKEQQITVPPDDNLFQLIDYPPWDREERTKFDEEAVFDYIAQNPHCVRAEYSFKNKNRGSTRNYPLSRLIALGASLKLVRKVHKLYPPAMTSTNEFRSTTLHAACMYPSSLEVLQYILEHNSEAIRQTSRHVFLPLHQACQADIPAPISLEAVKILVVSYPEALLKINKLGDIPLSTAQRNNASLPEVVDYLQQETKQPGTSSANFTSKEITDTTTSSSSGFCVS